MASRQKRHLPRQSFKDRQRPTKIPFSLGRNLPGRTAPPGSRSFMRCRSGQARWKTCKKDQSLTRDHFGTPEQCSPAAKRFRAQQKNLSADRADTAGEIHKFENAKAPDGPGLSIIMPNVISGAGDDAGEAPADDPPKSAAGLSIRLTR